MCQEEGKKKKDVNASELFMFVDFTLYGCPTDSDRKDGVLSLVDDYGN